VFNVRLLGGVIFGLVVFWGCGIGVAGLVVVVNGRESAEEEAVDVGEDSGTASGDAVGSQEAIDIGEGEVDALSGLKILGSGEEIVGQVVCFFLFVQGKVRRTEPGMRVSRKLTALTT
jgi:hypothetical protein